MAPPVSSSEDIEEVGMKDMQDVTEDSKGEACILSQPLPDSACAYASDQDAGCGSDHELLIAKFRLKLKRVGKITRPFRYNLNKISCDHTVEVTIDSRD